MLSIEIFERIVETEDDLKCYSIKFNSDIPLHLTLLKKKINSNYHRYTINHSNILLFKTVENRIYSETIFTDRESEKQPKLSLD